MPKLQKLRFHLAQYIDQTFEAHGDLHGWQPFYDAFVAAAHERAQVVSRKRTDLFQYALNRIEANRKAVLALRHLQQLIGATEVGWTHLTGDLISWYASDMRRTCDELLELQAKGKSAVDKLSSLEADDPRDLFSRALGHDGFVLEVAQLMEKGLLRQTEECHTFYLMWAACQQALNCLDARNLDLRQKMEFAEPTTRLGACCRYLLVCRSLVDRILEFAAGADMCIDLLLQKARAVDKAASLAACLAIAHVLKIRRSLRQMGSFFMTQLGTGLEDCRQCISACEEQSSAPPAALA